MRFEFSLKIKTDALLNAVPADSGTHGDGSTVKEIQHLHFTDTTTNLASLTGASAEVNLLQSNVATASTHNCAHGRSGDDWLKGGVEQKWRSGKYTCHLQCQPQLRCAASRPSEPGPSS